MLFISRLKEYQVQHEYYPQLAKEFKEIKDQKFLKKNHEIELGYLIELDIKKETT